MFYLICIFIAFLGLILGSYLNSWMWRVHEGKWQWGGRSMCIHCSRQLAWWENVPLVSFVILKGKCRTCKGVIPPRYFGVELATPILFIVVAAWELHFPTINPWQFFRDIFFTALLVVIFMYDLTYYEILPGLMLLGALVALAINIFTLHLMSLSLVLGMVVAAGFFLLQYLISKGTWIGQGDIYLGILMGALVGWPNIIVALFIAYVGGALISVPLLAFKKKTMNSPIPFGTFLAAGTLVALLFGDAIVRWYLGLLGM